jgi:hypothetical protein
LDGRNALTRDERMRGRERAGLAVMKYEGLRPWLF